MAGFSQIPNFLYTNGVYPSVYNTGANSGLSSNYYNGLTSPSLTGYDSYNNLNYNTGYSGLGNNPFASQQQLATGQTSQPYYATYLNYGNPYSNITYNNSSDSSSFNFAYNDLYGLSLGETIRSMEASTPEGGRMPNFGGNINQRKLYDIMRLANGEIDAVIDDMWRIAGDTFNNASFSKIQDSFGTTTEINSGGFMSQSLYDSIKMDTRETKMMSTERTYITELIKTIALGPDSGIKPILIACGYPDNQDTANKAQQIYNRMLPNIHDFNYRVAVVTETMKDRESSLGTQAQYIKTEVSKSKQTAQQLAQKGIGQSTQT